MAERVEVTQGELIALAERCEAAEGADRELDRLIRDTVWFHCINAAAEYTGSVDAALRLCGDAIHKPGNELADDHPFSILNAAIMECPLDNFDALPRFICAAALRARATKGPGHDR